MPPIDEVAATADALGPRRRPAARQRRGRRRGPRRACRAHRNLGRERPTARRRASGRRPHPVRPWRAAAPAQRSTGRCSTAATTCRAAFSPAASARPMHAPRRASELMASTSVQRSKPSPGVKDPDKVTALFAALRPAVPWRHGMRMDGRFGRFGGAYVPEILVPALEQLEAAFLDAQQDDGLQRRAGGPAVDLCRAADAADPVPQPRRGQGAHLPEARGSAPRRRAQDQPGAGAGPAGASAWARPS